jgi:hypothetical protein
MPEVVPLNVAAVEAGIAPARLYNAMARGEVTGRKVKKGWVVDRVSLTRYVRAQRKARQLAHTNH